MTSWSDGYVTEIEYTHGYYRELSPSALGFALLHAGVAAAVPGRRLRYLELGFGQGLSLAIHAAACPGDYWGTDFNPAHAANARALLAGAGIEAHIFDLGFAELASVDLPEFDIIALHGIWTWISAANRAAIVELVRRRLTAGGLLYVSYNCSPGWATVLPLRHLIKTHAELAATGGQGIVQKIDQALEFAQSVIGCGARYFLENPGATARLETIRTQERKYLAHEYFDRDWHVMPFSEVAETLAAAKLHFAASANLLDHLDAVNLTPEMHAMLAGVHNPVLKETVRDYLVNSQFRKDIYVKGHRRRPALEHNEALQQQRFVLLAAPDEVPMKLMANRGEVSLQEPVYQPLLRLLAADAYAPKRFADLLANPGWEGRPPAILIEALVVLSATAAVHVVQDDATIAAARPGCAALNLHLCRLARHSNEVGYLASPVTGGGVPATRLQQIFLLARASGLAGAAEWGAFAWNILAAQNQRLIKDGKLLETSEENLAEIQLQAQSFATGRLPLLTALGIAPP